MSSSEDREAFIALDEDEGMMTAIDLKSGDVVFDITEWDRAEPAEESSIDPHRYVMSRSDFLRFWDWVKERV